MRLRFDPRAGRLLRRVPRTDPWAVAEYALLALLAVQCARLAWTLATPVGPVGDWRAPGVPAVAAAPAAGFDPFFRLAPGAGGPAVVTSLDLKLYGVRQDRASGRGSAIIATPDGQQRSFAVGEEIVPGVVLKSVAFDSVTIAREGRDEQLFMAQADAAQGAGAGAAPTGPPPVQTPPPPTVTVPQVVAPPPPPGNAATDVSFSPRMNGGALTGVVVRPKGSGAAFRAANLQPGDVIVALNGRRISGSDRNRDFASEFVRRDLVLQVERNGQVMTIRPGDRQ